jgi:glycerophosphoryl diester phosphodiesterase
MALMQWNLMSCKSQVSKRYTSLRYLNSYFIHTRLTKDNVPIIMHDDVLGRTIAGEGSISDRDASELLQMDAGIWWDNKLKFLSEAIENNSNTLGLMRSVINDGDGPRLIQEIKSLPRHTYAGELVPTYRDVAQYCKDNNIWMNVEIKPAPGFDVETGEVVARMTAEIFAEELSKEQPDLTVIPLFSSFSFDSLNAAQRISPNIPRGFLVEDIPQNWKDLLTQLNAPYLHCNHELLTPDVANDVKQAGYGLFCYTCNSRERAIELFGMGVDALCTDRIDLLKDLL